MELSELRSEVKALKTMLLDSQSFKESTKIPMVPLSTSQNSQRTLTKGASGLPSWQTENPSSSNYLSFKSNSSNVTQSTTSSTETQPTTNQPYTHILQEAEQVNKERQQVIAQDSTQESRQTPSNPTNSSVESYPKNFATIANMVKNGQTPTDIKEIDDKPRNPNAQIESGRPSPTKPYERQKSISTPKDPYHLEEETIKKEENGTFSS